MATNCPGSIRSVTSSSTSGPVLVIAEREVGKLDLPGQLDAGPAPLPAPFGRFGQDGARPLVHGEASPTTRSTAPSSPSPAASREPNAA